VTRAESQSAWFRPALDLLNALPSETDPRVRTFLSRERPLWIARAPGRLDVMGGIADYSGARVLELPLARATVAVAQDQPDRHCDITTHRAGRWDCFSIDLPLAQPAELAAWFRRHETERWAAYVVGVAQVLLAQSSAPGGLRILVDSTVPEGRGVASSAALEVAVAMAVAACRGLDLGPNELAALCQRVENHVVGAPCGIMDQLTSACGRQDHLLQLHCQPGTIEGYIAVPSGYRFYGIDSGISHAVSGSDYGTVRTAAFMGHRILTVETEWRGNYLADLTPEKFARVADRLPEQMSGKDFLERYGGISDTATVVSPDRRYPVRAATEHPVREQQRVDRFAQLLPALSDQPDVAAKLGQLMYGSHESYGACGLGSDGTDRLVELVRVAGPKSGLFGAKITGGGSGGMVAVLGTIEADSCVRAIAARYAAETGRAAQVFTESGPGAAEVGVLRRP
jgi:L-arabinokinase